MRLTDVAYAVPVFLLWIACAPPADRAATNDGQACKADTECDSRSCEVDGVCRGSSCEKDDGCREGWTCFRRTNALGRTSGVCVNGDAGAVAPATVTIEIVEPPREQWLSLHVDEAVKLRVVTNEGARVEWKVSDGAPVETAFTYQGVEATHTFTKAGRWFVSVTSIVGSESATAEAALDVE